MQVIVLLARLLLSAVFVVAAVGKLADQRGSRQAMLDFGIPIFLTAPLGLLLPLTELVVALALIPQSTSWLAAILALILLLAFIGGIGYNLAHGRKPDCHCFGRLHSAPAGWSTLIRNGLLAITSGMVIGFGQADKSLSAFAWIGAISGLERVGLSIVVVVIAALLTLGWFIIQLIQQNGRLLLRIEAIDALLISAGVAPPPGTPNPGLAIGTPAPEFQLQDVVGELVSLTTLRQTGKPILLVFTDPGCGPCNALLPDLAHYQHDHNDQLMLALISSGPADLNRAKAMENGLAHVLLQHDQAVATAYHSSATPGAVLVRPDGTIGSLLAQGSDQIKSLVVQTLSLPQNRKAPNTRNTAQPNQLELSEPAPSRNLVDLNGKAVELASYIDKKTLILFWNPGCGFCQRMLADLKEWEANPAPGAPSLLVVSTGDLAMNVQQGFQSPVVLDQGFHVGHEFGIGGTPSGVLIDDQGKIASAPVVGAPEVLALLGAVKTRA